jgi:hypothetical protein
MIYTKSDFGKALLLELDKGYDVERLSHFAFEVFMNHQGELDIGVGDDIMEIVVMEEGVGFELTEAELRTFAESLIDLPSDIYDYSGYELIMKSTGAKVSFEREINKVLVCQNMLIVLVERGPSDKENIFGVNINGDIIWQIERMNREIMCSSFTNIALKNEKLMAYNRNDCVYNIDPMTGRIF